MNCEYGCGQEANFILKNGKHCCSKRHNSCPEIRKICSKGLKKAWREGRIIYKHNPKRAWSKGLTKYTNESLMKSSVDRKGCVGTFTGKKHTLKTKELISSRMTGHNRGLVKTKYYDVYCPYLEKTIKVQGTWEYKYAQYLNENQIRWTRDRKTRLRYRLYEHDYLHSYYPDFYLVDFDEFIEIKGFMWKSKDGRVDDERKLEKVKEYNPTLKLTILMSEELTQLGIKI